MNETRLTSVYHMHIPVSVIHTHEISMFQHGLKFIMSCYTVTIHTKLPQHVYIWDSQWYKRSSWIASKTDLSSIFTC